MTSVFDSRQFGKHIRSIPLTVMFLRTTSFIPGTPAATVSSGGSLVGTMLALLRVLNAGQRTLNRFLRNCHAADLSLLAYFVGLYHCVMHASIQLLI